MKLLADLLEPLFRRAFLASRRLWDAIVEAWERVP